MILYVTCSTPYFDLMRTQAQQKMSAHVSKQRKSHQFITDQCSKSTTLPSSVERLSLSVCFIFSRFSCSSWNQKRKFPQAFLQSRRLPSPYSETTLHKLCVCLPFKGRRGAVAGPLLKHTVPVQVQKRATFLPLMMQLPVFRSAHAFSINLERVSTCNVYKQHQQEKEEEEEEDWDEGWRLFTLCEM